MIAVDVGNTKTAIGYFRGPEVRGAWKFGTEPARTTDGYRALLAECLGEAEASLRTAGGMIVASVVPAVTERIEALADEIDLHVVTHRTPLSFLIAVPEPATIGADRIANLEGAVRKAGAPVIVLDVGTATTLSAIDSERRFVGGVIAPGLRISAEALFARTAALPPVDLGTSERAIGATTQEAMRSGILRGHARMIDGLVGEVRRELRSPDAPVIGAGGGLEWIVPHLETGIAVVPTLTMEGLRFLFENVTRGGSDA